MFIDPLIIVLVDLLLDFLNVNSIESYCIVTLDRPSPVRPVFLSFQDELSQLVILTSTNYVLKLSTATNSIDDLQVNRLNSIDRVTFI
jgi:hypothetical protein